MPVRKAIFLKSSTRLSQLPPPTLPEVVFVGRSNVGKSSLINALAGQRHLARTSGTPGKTREINHYLMDDAWYLVDLPGYGYAKLSKTQHAELQTMITAYCAERQGLRQVFVLVDCRLEPQPIDLEFMEFLALEARKPFTVLFTKQDKVPPRALARTLEVHREAYQAQFGHVPPLLTTSSEHRLGLEELLAHIAAVTA